MKTKLFISFFIFGVLGIIVAIIFMVFNYGSLWGNLLSITILVVSSMVIVLCSIIYLNGKNAEYSKSRILITILLLALISTGISLAISRDKSQYKSSISVPEMEKLLKEKRAFVVEGQVEIETALYEYTLIKSYESSKATCYREVNIYEYKFLTSKSIWLKNMLIATAVVLFFVFCYVVIGTSVSKKTVN